MVAAFVATFIGIVLVLGFWPQTVNFLISVPSLVFFSFFNAWLVSKSYRDDR